MVKWTIKQNIRVTYQIEADSGAAAIREAAAADVRVHAGVDLSENIITTGWSKDKPLFWYRECPECGGWQFRRKGVCGDCRDWHRWSTSVEDNARRDAGTTYSRDRFEEKRSAIEARREIWAARSDSPE